MLGTQSGRVQTQQPWWERTRLNALQPALARTPGADRGPDRRAGRVVGRRVRACSYPVHFIYGSSGAANNSNFPYNPATDSQERPCLQHLAIICESQLSGGD